MRVDLRPITLLFGNNSAGKSTIIQALCYAHEILSHRNVDRSQDRNSAAIRSTSADSASSSTGRTSSALSGCASS